MRKGFELWDPTTGNLVGYYRSERAALRDVLDTVERYGPESTAALSLGLVGPAGLVAEGEALIERALTTANARRAPAAA